jgi:hypothetical protein
MCAMPDSNTAPAIRESGQADFSHGLQEFRTARECQKLGLLRERARDREGLQQKGSASWAFAVMDLCAYRHGSVR